MEDSTYGNAVNEDLRRIHRMVETVKNDQRVIRMHIQMVEDIKKQAEEIMKLREKNTEQEEEITKQAEEITKQAEEIKRLRELLNQ